MMHSSFYFTILVAALTGLWFVWDFGLKRLFLDMFRERIFELRFQLFNMGMSGELSFDGDTYRSLEILFNGLLRYAHRFTFMTYIFSSIEQDRAKRDDKDYVDFSKQIDLKISRMAPETREKLLQIIKKMHTALMIYVGFSSLLFLTAAIIYLVLRALHITKGSKKEEVSAVFEREAYRQELRRPRLAVA